MPVTWAKQAVACETCSVWYHINCQGISSQTYDALHSSAVVWNCHSCGVTNYTATLFDLTSLVTSNSFSSLQEDSSIHSICGSPGPPLAASSPTPRQRRKPNKVKRPLPLVNVNFHSIRNKQAEVLNLIHSTQADVLVGTETWLTPDHLSSEYFPQTRMKYSARTDQTATVGSSLQSPANFYLRRCTTCGLTEKNSG